MDAPLEWMAALVERYPALRLDLLARLAVAAVLGGVIGWERETAHKPAGLRTNVLICVGAALLTDLSVRLSGDGDPMRLSAQIVSGIGFLGAGTIIQARGSVTGLTTAATLWVVAAIGIAAGAGLYVEAVGTTLLVLFVLIPLRILDARPSWRGRERRAGADRRRDGEPEEADPGQPGGAAGRGRGGLS